MNKRQHILFKSIIVILFIISSCSPRSTGKEGSFIKLISTDDVNKSIILENDPRIGDKSVVIVNKSQQRVQFPIDFNLRIYMYDDKIKSWIEIHNDVTYLNKPPLILEPKRPGTDFEPFFMVGFKPVLRKDQLPIAIRVIVSGTTNRNEVAAFIDILYKGD